jgi:hypothetical protein
MHFAGEGGCYGVLSDGKLRLFLLAEAPTFLSFFAFSGWGSFISPIKFRRPSPAAMPGRKVGTTQSTMLPNGKGPGIQRPREQRVPQKITATGNRGKGENAV